MHLVSRLVVAVVTLLGVLAAGPVPDVNPLPECLPRCHEPVFIGV